MDKYAYAWTEHGEHRPLAALRDPERQAALRGPSQFGLREWAYPRAWIEPLRWFWGQLQWPTEQGPDDRGITWIELACSFERTTRVLLRTDGAAGAPNSMLRRAMWMSDASRRLARADGCGFWEGRLIQKCQALVPFGVLPTAGFSNRPMMPSAIDVGRQLATIVEDHTGAGRQGSPWHSTEYRGAWPPARWKGRPAGGQQR